MPANPILVEPRNDDEPESPYGLCSTAFYDDVPLTAIWMEYQEPLQMFVEMEVI